MCDNPFGYSTDQANCVWPQENSWVRDKAWLRPERNRGKPHHISSVLSKWDTVALQMCVAACWKPHQRFSWKSHKNKVGSFYPTTVRKGSQLRVPRLNIPTGRDGQQRSITGDNHSWGRALAGEVMQEGVTKEDETDCDKEALHTE